MEKSHNSKILLLEDDEDLALLMKEYFKGRGYKVDWYTDPLTPLSKLRKSQNPDSEYDVFLTDLKMPNMDGITWLSHTKQLAPLTPVILTTAHGGLETAVETIRAGAYDFVLKPIKFQQLTVSIERAIALKKLNLENTSLKSAIQTTQSVNGLIAKSDSLKKVLDLVKRVSNSSATIFISGESGTGKEVVSRLIHSTGNRSEGPFIPINCSAIPENLLESELFGYAKGAFTGAVSSKSGLFEAADGGTLFLDEIGDLSLPLQAKILRVLQERKVNRLGETEPREFDVRIITATHKNLHEEVREKRFREDLFFRLNVIPIVIPPIRNRKEDLIPLAEHFLKKFNLLNGKNIKGFSKKAFEYLYEHNWPGNVRELENAIERAVVLNDSDLIDAEDLKLLETNSLFAAAKPVNTSDSSFSSQEFGAEHFLDRTDLESLPSLADFNLKYIQYVLNKVNGVRERAARILNIDRKTLYKRISEMEANSPTPIEDNSSPDNAPQMQYSS